MTFTDRRQRFRAVLEGSRCVQPGSVFDPISTRLAEQIGFETGIFAGSSAALTVLGGPDLVVLTLTEFAEQLRRATRAAALPLLVDADHGYGNALSVMRTVQELECAGAAALTIEDTLLPRPFGNGKVALISPEEGQGKLRAALAARGDPSLVIVARTSAFGISGTEDALLRVRAYAQAGADALFFAGNIERKQIEAVRAITSLPIILGGHDPKALGSNETLAELGVRIALPKHLPIMAAIRATYETLLAMRNGDAIDIAATQPSPELLRQATDAAAYEQAIRDFLTPKE